MKTWIATALLLTESHATLEETSLMQGLVARRGQLAEDKNDEPASLLKSAKNLARQVKRQTPEAVSAGIAAVNAALGQIAPQLEEGHAHAQQQIQAQLAEIQACHSSTSHGVAVRDDLTGQLAIMTACHEDVDAASQTQQVRCDAWASHASRMVFPSTNLPASSSSTERYNLAAQLRDWVEDHWPEVERQNAECEAATEQATTETERCAPVIAHFNEVFCQHHLACSLLSACNHHEVEVYYSLVLESEVGMTSRQDQYRTVKQTECLMQLVAEALSGNTTIEESDFDTCDGDADVQHLELSFPDPDVLADCPHLQPGDPQCAEVQLPLAWAGGEAEPQQIPGRQLASDGTGVLVSYAGVYPSPECHYDDVDAYPAYESYTVDVYITIFPEAFAPFPSSLDRHGFFTKGLLSHRWDLPRIRGQNPQGTTGWRIKITGGVLFVDHAIRGQGSRGPAMAFDRNGIEIGVEFRLTVTYDSSTRTLTAYINGNVAVAEPVTNPQHFTTNPFQTDFLSPAGLNNEDGENHPEWHGAQVPFCIGTYNVEGSEEDLSPINPDLRTYRLYPEQGHIRDATLSAGVFPP